MFKSIMLLALLLLLTTTVNAGAPNTYFAPSCFRHVNDLPIFRITAKLNSQSSTQKKSSVVLIDQDTWRTTAHSVYYDIGSYVVIHTATKDIVAQVILVEHEKDVAYLVAKSGNLKPISKITSRIKVHESVWNIGYPGMYKVLMSFEGMYVRRNKKGLITVSALGLGGMSGGATVRCNDGNLEMLGTITSIKRTVLSERVRTDIEGEPYLEKILVNAGYSIIAPSVSDTVK